MSNKKAENFFTANPHVKEVFETTDGYIFIKKGDAVNHAKTLNPDSPVVETIENTESKEDVKTDTVKKSTPAELKAIKENAVKEYTELFGEAPDSKLTAPKIQELIDAKNAELQKSGQ